MWWQQVSLKSQWIFANRQSSYTRRLEFPLVPLAVEQQVDTYVSDNWRTYIRINLLSSLICKTPGTEFIKYLVHKRHSLNIIIPWTSQSCGGNANISFKAKINQHYIARIDIYVNQPDTRCFMIEFIHNTWWLDMFRTSVVHPHQRLQAVCCEIGMWWFAYYSIRPDVMRL